MHLLTMKRVKMFEFIIIMTFVVVAYYVTEKDNKESELYKILYKKGENMHIIEATYIGDFKFIVHFSNGKIKEVDIKRVADVDSRYGELESFKVLQDENFVKNMKIENSTLSFQNIDIAPEILYQVAIMSEEHDEYEEIAKIIKERVTDRKKPAVMISHEDMMKRMKKRLKTLGRDSSHKK